MRPMDKRSGTALIGLLLATSAMAVPADFPMQPGELVGTCFSGPFDAGPNVPLDTAGYVVGVMDTRVPPVGANPIPVAGATWPVNMFHNEFTPTTPQDVWNARNLGQIFGAALDNASPPNIYVTATTAYGDFTDATFAHPAGGFGPSGYAGVYRLDALTGDIIPLTTTVAPGFGGVGTSQIPNSGPALGNICHDPAHRQLFVSNFEDGRIYRLDMFGTILSVHDPFGPDVPAPGFERLGERVWAVQRHGDRLYYSVWLRDSGRPATPWNPAAGPAPVNPNNAIFSIAIDGTTGDFTGPDNLEIVLPYLSTTTRYSNPVADIAFSQGGDMILAERTMNGDFGVIDLGHGARVLEYTYSGAWTPSGDAYHIGSTFNATANMYANSSGGTDYDCADNVWSSGDTLLFGPTVYGWQHVPAGGNSLATPTSTSYFIDPGLFKASIGDVEVYRACSTLDACTVAPDGTSCNGECAAGDGICHPTEILTDAAGNFLEVTCCSCEFTTCHIDIDPASQEVFCRKLMNCPTPPGGHCSPVRQGNADGTISMYCECIGPDTPPSECAFGSQCNENCPGTCVERCLGICPDAEEACLPSVITESFPGAADFTVDACDCDPVSPDLCRPVIDAAGAVSCVGKCDDPTLKCELVVTTAADGIGQEYRCDPCAPAVERGACCHIDAVGNITCTVTTQADCEQTLFGQYLGDDTNCTTHGYLCEEVLQDPGACCYQEQGTNVCAVLSQTECEDVLGGNWLGAGVPCDPDPCPQTDPEGACCYEDAAGNILCTVATAIECETVLVGIFQGANTDCDPNPCSQKEGCDCQGNCDDRTPSYPDASYAPFTDEVAVVTEYSWFGTDPVLVNVDVKNRNTAPIYANWTVRTNSRYSHPSWIRDNLGTVFGVALDSRGHTYVTATTAFATDHEGIGAGGSWGTVYQIHASTAAISVFANLPNNGPGLGNICYDGPDDQFFVSNHEDGRIYRLDSTGACQSTFDHATGVISSSCAPETGDGPGYAPLGERVWGVQTYNGRLYYGVWTEDYGRPSSSATNTIWSIALSGGDFAGTAVQEIAMPPLPATNYAQPPADISFSETGCMLIAERGMFNDSSPSAHNARVLEYRQTLSGVWWPSPYTFGIGEISFGSDNAAGGVDYDREGNVWATGDALQFSPLQIYGLQSLPCTGGVVTDSVLVDLNGIYSTSDKTDIGDVEIGCAEKCLTPPRRMTAWFPLDEPSGVVAEEIVWDNDGVYTGTTPIAGMVAGARRFNGADFVRVPNGALINFGQGDFSIDAWVRATVVNGVQLLVEKRAIPTRGYSFYLYNGQLGFQLADGAGFTNWVRPGLVADGLWHHVAVTVDRNNPNGLVLYVDGVGTVYDPTPHPGSVTTNSPLWLGARDPAFGQIFYRGDLDEVELFRRALRPSEVLALYDAGRQGKCKDRCHLPWDAQLCRNRNTVTVDLTICNDSSVAHNYTWSLAGNNNCSSPGPTVFSPSAGVTNVPAGGCVQVPITITRPVGMVAPQVACYNVTISNLDTGHTFGCEGSIWARNKWCLIIIDIGSVPIGVPIGWRPRPIGVLVQNDADDRAVFDYAFEVMPSDMDPDAPVVVSLNGLPPGEPVSGSIQVPLGTERRIDVDVQFSEHVPMGFYDLLVMTSSGSDDGVAVPALSVAMHSVLPCGDLDRSGAIDDGDVPLFESCLAGPNASSACPAPLDADCDDDGDVDLGDFAQIQKFFSAVYYTP